jgi:selenocysteine lyase/cysteine desulfurase
MAKLDLVATNRASYYLYTVREEIDQLADGLVRVREQLA